MTWNWSFNAVKIMVYFVKSALCFQYGDDPAARFIIEFPLSTYSQSTFHVPGQPQGDTKPQQGIIIPFPFQSTLTSVYCLFIMAGCALLTAEEKKKRRVISIVSGSLLDNVKVLLPLVCPYEECP